MPLKRPMWGKAKDKRQSCKCPEKNEGQTGKFSILEGKQKLMWKTATPITSICFILIPRVLSSRPCGTTLHARMRVWYHI